MAFRVPDDGLRRIVLQEELAAVLERRAETAPPWRAERLRRLADRRRALATTLRRGPRGPAA